MVTYNGRTFSEFLPQTASVYIDQEDQHLAELTVRETMDFSALCQGAGHKKGAGTGSRKAGAAGILAGDTSPVGGCKGTCAEDRICLLQGIDICAPEILCPGRASNRAENV